MESREGSSRRETDRSIWDPERGGAGWSQGEPIGINREGRSTGGRQVGPKRDTVRRGADGSR